MRDRCNANVMAVMLIVRTLVQWLFLVAWSIVWITLAIALRVVTFSARGPLWMARHLWAPGLLWGAGVTLRVRHAGADGFAWDQPHIFVMNHQSLFDIVVAFRVLRCPLRFIAKQELAWIPFLGWYMWATGMIFVNRSRPTKAVVSLSKAAQRVRDGASIIAFPEGTRSRSGAIGSFKKGIFHVATQAGVPVVPVTLEGAQHVLPRGQMVLRGGVVDVWIGTPIAVQGQSPDQVMRDTRTAMVMMHAQRM